MLSGALQRKAKHEARLSNIQPDSLVHLSSGILRSVASAPRDRVLKINAPPESTHLTRFFRVAVDEIAVEWEILDRFWEAL